MGFQPFARPFGQGGFGRSLGQGGGSGGFSVTVTPSQALGSELLTDGGMENWLSATDLTNWTEVISALSTVNRDADAHSGSFAARLDVDAVNSLVQILQTIAVTAGDFVELQFWAKSGASSTAFRADLGTAGISFTATPTTYVPYRALTRTPATNPSQTFFRSTASRSIYIDDVSDKKLTPNIQITAPSANMRLTQFYTLPTPNIGTQVWVMPRISAFSTGNYWLVHLRYTGSQWDIDLYSVAAHTRTSRTSSTNIGTTNGIRINCKGDLFDLQTTVNGGANWVTQGSQVNNSLYNTATDLNVMSTSDVTLGALTYEQAV